MAVAVVQKLTNRLQESCEAHDNDLSRYFHQTYPTDAQKTALKSEIKALVSKCVIYPGGPNLHLKVQPMFGVRHSWGETQGKRLSGQFGMNSCTTLPCRSSPRQPTTASLCRCGSSASTPRRV
jgi:hypothetical protein